MLKIACDVGYNSFHNSNSHNKILLDFPRVYIIPMNSIEANEQRQQQQPPLQRAVAVINLQQHQQEAQGQQQQQDGFRCYP